MSYPDDEDGDALRRVATTADMSRPMDIDFFILVPDQAAGEQLLGAVRANGCKARLSFDEESDVWSCTCTKTMLATYDGVIDTQRALQELAAPFGGTIDGWGTMGN